MKLRICSLALHIFILLLLLVACNSDAEVGQTATATPPIPTPADTPAPDISIDTGDINDSVVENPTSLIVWTIPDIAPGPGSNGGLLLSRQIDAFNATHPDLELIVEAKTATGQGGILSYLQSGRTVAPTILPDLILIPTEQLRDAASAELIFPLEDLLSEEAQSDLFPVSRALGEVNDTFYGYPYALTGLTHLAYNTTAISETVPSQWPLLADTPASFGFPAFGPSGTRLLLQFYLAEGGALTDDTGQPLLELEPLTRALEQFESGRQENFVSAQAFTFSSLDDSWQAYQSNTLNMVETTAGQYLANRSSSISNGFAALPGPNGPLTPHVTGWAWAISTPDPARQALAAELLTWLVNAPNMGTWSLESQRLPTRRTAYERWPSDPYIAFLQQEISRATPYPIEAVGIINEALSQAITAVVSPAADPAGALAQRAVDAVGP